MAALLPDKLPEALSETQKDTKVTDLMKSIAHEGKIVNAWATKKPVCRLSEE